MSDKRLEGQVAWITGGASGMGRAIADLFSAHGASVAVVDNNSAGDAWAKELRAKKRKALFSRCDVSNEEQVRASIAETVEAFGALHIVVNCAGIVHVTPLHECSVQDWDLLMGVNVKSIFLSIKHSLQHLRRNKRSYVVNIGSVGSFIGQASTPAYIASKGAVLQLSRAIALDYAVDGVRCNCVCPGITDTPMLRYHLNKSGDGDAMLAKRLRRVPMGVALSPDDIARAALYFSCEDSSGITGTSLIVDGGYLATAEWETDRPTKFMDPV
jgi:NAD(P)-dependent dehydrogenase (short-subunit alcohol dehydrogenase family)